MFPFDNCQIGYCIWDRKPDNLPWIIQVVVIRKGMLQGGIMKKAPVQDSNRLYREALLEKREEVLAGLGVKFDTLAKMGRLAEEDQAQLTHDEYVSLHFNSLDYGQLRLVEEALDRLEAGDYGTCLACEELIPAKRLRALPWARYCIPCQESSLLDGDPEQDEARERQPVSVK
jgi:DnaK suppressor protein